MGNDEIFATGFTNESGHINLPVEAQSIGTATITVTAHDYQPYQSTINIIQESVFINSDAVTIDDDNSGTSSGNNNGLVNPGENVELNVRLKNYGTNSANNVSAVISTSSPYVIVSDNYEFYGSINSGSSVYSSDDFDISIDPGTIGGMELLFDLNISNEFRTEWSDNLLISVNGPNLYVQDYTVIDGNNSIIDPGETIELVITAENIGNTSAPLVSGTLTCTNSAITILDANGYFGTINAETTGDNSGNTFQIEAGTQLYPGTQIPFELRFTNPTGYDNTVSFFIDIGEVNVTDPLGADSYGYYCYDDNDTDYGDVVPEYDWIEIDPNYGGPGTLIYLVDNGFDGDTQSIPLPFQIWFYGLRYLSLTVCSNGWVTPGSTDLYSF